MGAPLTARPDAHELERCARKITGQPALRVKGWQEMKSTDGRTVAFEVDTEQ